MNRVSKINYYLDIAQTTSERSTCLRRRYGAIIVKNDVIVATGYNGAPRGRKNCTDLGVCYREKMNIPHGERYELCRSVHAEMNAIIAAPYDRLIGSALYLACVNPSTGNIEGGVCSCSMCKRHIINAGIEKVIVRETPEKFITYNVRDWILDDDSLNTEKQL